MIGFTGSSLTFYVDGFDIPGLVDGIVFGRGLAEGAHDQGEASGVDLPVGGGDPAALQGPDASDSEIDAGRFVGTKRMRYAGTLPTVAPVCE